MEDVKPSLLATALRAWSDAWRAIAAMPPVFAIALGCMVLMSTADVLVQMINLPPEGSPRYEVAQFGIELLSVALDVISGVLVAPFLIAVHRHVLLHQVTKGYPLAPSNSRFLRFAGFSVLLSLLWELPALTYRLAALILQPSEKATFIAMSALFALFIVAVLVVTIRRLIVFPAVAVDAADAGWRRAQMMTKGHSWRIFFMLVLVLLPPAIALTVLLFGFTRLIEVGGLAGVLLFWLGLGAARLLLLAILAAAVSHFYRALDPTLGQPARPIPTVAA